MTHKYNPLKVLSDYKKVLELEGVKEPIFLMTKEFKRALMSPDCLDFIKGDWVSLSETPPEIKNIQGAVGIYDGVILVDASSVY